MVAGKEHGERHRTKIVALFATMLATVAVLGACEDRIRTIDCGSSVQERVDEAAAGSTVDLPDGCVYRQSVVIGKPLTLIGGPGVEIRGSDVWEGWSNQGSLWRSARPVPDFGSARVQCKTGTERCKWPEQVFFDGEPLRQVASDPGPGQFALDEERHVLLAEDPADYEVEVTTRKGWLRGVRDTHGVTVDGITFRHAANIRGGALRNSGDRWVVENSDLAYAHSVNVSLTERRGLKLLNNEIHHAGQMGVGSNDVRSIDISGNEIHHNNVEDFDPGWAAGGIKASDVKSLVATNNDIHHNPKGIWTDVGAQNLTIADNRVHHNSIRGIDLEITGSVEVSDNVAYENGWGGVEESLTEAGILLKSVRDAKVHDNVVAWNDAGITILNPQRQNGQGAKVPRYDLVYDVRVLDNTILSEAGGPALAWKMAYAGGNIFKPSADNRGNGNSYWYPSSEGSYARFYWDGPIERLSEFSQTPGGGQGRYLSEAEKDEVAADKNIPAEPRDAAPAIASSPSST